MDRSYTDTPTTLHSSLQSHIASLEPWESMLLSHHTISDNDQDIVASSTNQTTIIATDGSEDNGKGSYAWIIATPLGDILAQGWGTVFGYKISSFRCESYAILAALRFIIQLRRFYFLPSSNPNITWWCDCKSLIQLFTTFCTSPRSIKASMMRMPCATFAAMPSYSSESMASMATKAFLYTRSLLYRRLSSTLERRFRAIA